MNGVRNTSEALIYKNKLDLASRTRSIIRIHPEYFET